MTNEELKQASEKAAVKFQLELARRAQNYQAQFANQRPWPSIAADFDARVQAALSPPRSNRWGVRIWRAIFKAVKP